VRKTAAKSATCKPRKKHRNYAERILKRLKQYLGIKSPTEEASKGWEKYKHGRAKGF
jgi:hypothetical protein